MDLNDPVLLEEAFKSMDKDKSGAIGPAELQKGLSNGTERPFNLKTCKLCIAIFDKNNSGTIGWEEFRELWGFINIWVKAYEEFDKDGSGGISKLELNQLFNVMSYRFGDKFYTAIMNKFGKKDGSDGGQLFFDDFLFICLMLHMLTGAFANFDKRREGTIALTYDEFMELAFDATASY